MSFMFTPIDYDDTTAVNRPHLSPEVINGVVFSIPKMIDEMAKTVEEHMSRHHYGCVLAIDGYMGADFCRISNLLTAKLSEGGRVVRHLDMQDFYLPQAQIEQMLTINLPIGDPEDPIDLFGKVFDGSYDDFIDEDKVKAFTSATVNGTECIVTLLTGMGSASERFRPVIDLIAYIDMTSKQAAIRVRQGRAVNIGNTVARAHDQTMRRNYYVDYEVILALRKKLLQSGTIDFYIAGSNDNAYAMMNAKILRQLMTTMVNYPFRCKPVYMEGAWGGEFLRKVRGLPAEYHNIAWAYELIAFEVSVVICIGVQQVEFPFTTMIQQDPALLMGERCAQDFAGYFPIRLNYDDTYHGNGGLSIQVHPDEEYTVEHYNEKGAQDESYYVVAAGHGAKTFGGFRGDTDPDRFMELARQASEDGSEVDYLKYVHFSESKPGLQVMIPAGTIHASGRNQLVLEIGSLTTGAYTYKIFDYNRKDLNGHLRPIHNDSAGRVVRKERDSAWAEKTIMQQPQLLRSGEGYQEYLIGNVEEIYFRTLQVDLQTKYEASNNGQFTVLTLVDGEEVLVYSKSNPSFRYRQTFLNIVVIPATITDYVVENLGYQPAVIHRTELKPGYTISDRQRLRLDKCR